MNKNWQERTELLIKNQGQEILKKAHLLVVGLGGVGSFATEFLARAGVGEMTIIDGDEVDITNINRQLPALHSTIGKAKVEVVAERILDINPEIKLHKIKKFLNPEDMQDLFSNQKFDYVLDCIDSVSPKLELIKTARNHKTKIISAMGAGGKINPSKVQVSDISKTSNCFLAKQIRKRLRKERITKGFKCVFSTEIQDEESLKLTDGTQYKKSFYGTISFMPAIFGLYSAAEVIQYLLKKNEKN